MAHINFARGEDKGYTPLPEGDYDCKIEDVEQTTSSNGHPQLQVSLRIVDGPYADREPKTWYSLLPQSTWTLQALTDALGIEWEETGQSDSEGNPIYGFDTDELLGRVVTFKVTQNVYQGNTNNKFIKPQVSTYDTADESDESEAPEDEAGDEGEPEAEASEAKTAKPAKAPARRPRTRR